MNSKKTFSVAPIGISENEQRILSNIFRLSHHRARTYTLTKFSPSTTSDMLIVDADSLTAIAEWRSFRGDDQVHPAIPAVMVTNGQLSEPVPYHLRRPFIASRVLNVLDQVVIKELSFIPEVVISEDTHISNEAAAVLKNAAAKYLNHAVREGSSETLAKATNLNVKKRPHTILVVDDSLAIRKLVELELRLFGIRVDFAETGERALELLDKKTYDIVFLDIILPGVDGYKICKNIKKDRDKRQTSVIMLTSKSSSFDKVRGAFAGCDAYLTKPVSHNSFQKVIKEHLLKPASA